MRMGQGVRTGLGHRGITCVLQMQFSSSNFHPFFFLSPNYMLTLKICVGVFSGIFKARMLKFCIHMDNE